MQASYIASDFLSLYLCTRYKALYGGFLDGSDKARRIIPLFMLEQGVIDLLYDK
jgi:hypothetical protein